MHLKNGNISIRKFIRSDIEKKIDWINNPKNNTYLHYDIPLIYENTVAWYERIKDVDTRFDAVIEYNGEPVGLIGLLGIDSTNRKAEYYICLGEENYKGKGIATIASKLLIEYAFEEQNLNKIYLYTEEENIGAQRLFEKLGFKQEGHLKHDLIFKGRIVNRYIYSLLKEEYNKSI